MVTFGEAREQLGRVLVSLSRDSRDITGGLVVLEERTLTRPYGWVFFSTGKRLMETRDMRYSIAGNGPVVILADTGEAVILGSALPPSEEIAEFERERGLKA